MRQATYRGLSNLPLVPATCLRSGFELWQSCSPPKLEERRRKAGTQNWIPAGVYPRPRSGAGMSGMWLFAFVFFLMFASVQPAAADFRLCNNTASRVGVAVGYKDSEGWT